MTKTFTDGLSILPNYERFTLTLIKLRPKIAMVALYQTIKNLCLISRTGGAEYDNSGGLKNEIKTNTAMRSMQSKK
jgi:hypothetical protein